MRTTWILPWRMPSLNMWRRSRPETDDFRDDSCRPMLGHHDAKSLKFPVEPYTSAIFSHWWPSWRQRHVEDFNRLLACDSSGRCFPKPYRLTANPSAPVLLLITAGSNHWRPVTVSRRVCKASRHHIGQHPVIEPVPG
jgi:hypothetical protein